MFLLKNFAIIFVDFFEKKHFKFESLLNVQEVYINQIESTFYFLLTVNQIMNRKKKFYYKSIEISFMNEYCR